MYKQPECNVVSGTLNLEHVDLPVYSEIDDCFVCFFVPCLCHVFVRFINNVFVYSAVSSLNRFVLYTCVDYICVMVCYWVLQYIYVYPYQNKYNF